MGETFQSRRALLAAAAGGAAALAANATIGGTVVRAADEPLLKNTINSATEPTSLTAPLPTDTVFEVTNTDATSANTAIQGSSETGTGLAGQTMTGTGVSGKADNVGVGVRGNAAMTSGVLGTCGSWSGSTEETALTGVFGFAVAGDGVTTVGSGVWGDSPDIGVYGSGATGVVGDGGKTGWGLYGYSGSSYGLYVEGKVKFATRSGRVTIPKGRKSYTRTAGLSGVTAGSIVIAVLQQPESGTWVRAAKAGTNTFTVYFNRALPTKTVLGWLVLN